MSELPKFSYVTDGGAKVDIALLRQTVRRERPHPIVVDLMGTMAGYMIQAHRSCLTGDDLAHIKFHGLEALAIALGCTLSLNVPDEGAGRVEAMDKLFGLVREAMNLHDEVVDEMRAALAATKKEST